MNFHSHNVLPASERNNVESFSRNTELTRRIRSDDIGTAVECDALSRSRFADPGKPNCSDNPWKHVVLSLLSYPFSGISVPSWPPSARAGADRRFAGAGTSSSCTVTIDERLENRRITLSWNDPTRCSYRGQLWRYATARKSGICVLSGQPIRRGDGIFRPQFRTANAPRNRDAMILAAWIDNSCGALVNQR
jgi:hypothetical protein